VTVIGVETELDKAYLMFERVIQEVSWKSFEPWTLTLENGLSFTTRNPIGDYFAYQFRSPGGIKPKDIEKLIFLKRLVDDLTEKGVQNGISYFSNEYYGTWQEYIHRLEKSRIPSIQSKRFITSLYWKTIGTPLAHGRGLIGRPMLAIYHFIMRLRQ
jgi:hypothetical protein